ncbi:hypothetical protein PHMEG_00013909 [Phytophthora megakarya]|uniref:Peptidase A2 domain-containing protein n=1 Tax=Phytophthora megakarya TaxID=4795 RepID=A0A225W534_9STRA|nr:hypothetical protein PHMEG_00013909 [Phytophthora megakarya]
MSHSTHFCQRRCKFCKQVHEPGRCEVFQELTKLDRTNDQRTRILLDTGANVSIVSARYTKKLGLRDIRNQDCSMDTQGISKENATKTRRTTVKITLGWKRVYVFDMGGCPPRDRLYDPCRSSAGYVPFERKTPDEVSIPLIKKQAIQIEPEIHYEVSGPSATLNIPSSRRDIRYRRLTMSGLGGRNLWRRLSRVIGKDGHIAPYGVLASPLSNSGMGSARTSPARYRYTEWQVLAYAEARDKDLYKKEEKLYEQWLATQPSTVAQPEYTYPTSILQHEENETASDNLHEDRERSSDSDDSSDDSIELNFPKARPKLNFGNDVTVLENLFISVVKAITTKGYESSEDDVVYVHEPADVELTDYAQKLAFLPDLSDHSPTELDFSAANVLNSTLSDVSDDGQAKLKLYELLEGLLKANLVSFSNSQWLHQLL